MNGPVDRVENAALRYHKPEKVKRAAESAKEKDQKFTKILKEKFEENLKENRKKKKYKDEVVLHSQPDDEPKETVASDTHSVADSDGDQDDQSEDRQGSKIDHVDLKA